MQSIKKWMVLTLCLVLMATMVPLAGFAAGPNDFSDMPNDWSTPALKKAVENGLLTGSNGMIMPKSNLTRAQMAAILVRAFGANKLVNVSMFSDINTSQWYFKDISKAYAMGIFQGTGDKMNPEKYITREEVFTVLARALNLDPGKETSNWKFRDSTEISSWAKTSVAAMIEAGYITGSGGMLNPKANMTRAEFAALMDRIAKYYIRKEGTYTGTYDGSVMITVPGVILKDVTINGDLIIGDGVGDGEIILENVTILGRTIVRGLAQLVEGTDIEDENVALGPGGVPGANPNAPGQDGNNQGGGNQGGGNGGGQNNAKITYEIFLKKGTTEQLLTEEEVDANENKEVGYEYFEALYNEINQDLITLLGSYDDFITSALKLKGPSGMPYAYSISTRIVNYSGTLLSFGKSGDDVPTIYKTIVANGNATDNDVKAIAAFVLKADMDVLYADLASLYPSSENKDMPANIKIFVLDNPTPIENIKLHNIKQALITAFGKHKLSELAGKDVIKVQYNGESMSIIIREVK